MISSNIDEINKLFTQLDKNITDTKPVMHTIGEMILDKTQEAFEKEQDPITGQNWKELKTSSIYGSFSGKRLTSKTRKLTAKYKRHMKDKKKLRASHRLFRSITYSSTQKSVTIGSNMPYAAAHNFGSKKNNLPQRRFLPFSGSGESLDLENGLSQDIIKYLYKKVIDT